MPHFNRQHVSVYSAEAVNSALRWECLQMLRALDALDRIGHSARSFAELRVLASGDRESVEELVPYFGEGKSRAFEAAFASTPIPTVVRGGH